MEATIRQPFNQAQLELLSTMASLKTDSDLIELKQAIARFFVERADREMERLWENGTINEETLKSWEHEHMRTPYLRVLKSIPFPKVNVLTLDDFTYTLQ